MLSFGVWRRKFTLSVDFFLDVRNRTHFCSEQLLSVKKIHYLFHYNSVVSLKAFSLIVIQHVVELFYYGETRVLTSIKGQLIKALDFLEVDYDIPSNHRISSNFIPMGNVQVVTKPGEANKTTATPLNGTFLNHFFR